MHQTQRHALKQWHANYDAAKQLLDMPPGSKLRRSTAARLSNSTQKPQNRAGPDGAWYNAFLGWG